MTRQLKRTQLLAYFQQLEPCLTGLEACASAHHWAITLSALGHTVKLIAPQFVKPSVKGSKIPIWQAPDAFSKPANCFP